MRTLLVASTIFFTGAGTAFGQAFKDSLVQAPTLERPQRGSVAGSLSRLSFGPAELARGTFSLPAAIVYPSERGAPMADIIPRYSPENGLSEWGMGFSIGLSITRFRVLGDIDYVADELQSPWGRLELGTDGAYYPVGYNAPVRLQPVGGGWEATNAEGTRYLFEAADAVTNGSGTYRWMMSRVENTFGERTVLTWQRNASGRPFLARAEYGGRAGFPEYRVDVSYTALPKPFTDYRSNYPMQLDRRADHVTISAWLHDEARYQPRWTYTLEYLESPTGPAYYLSAITKTYHSGESDPPVTYQWVLAEEQLGAAALTPIPELDTYLAANGGDAIQPDRVSILDGDRDGRIELERPYDGALLRQTETGWIEEPLPPPDGTENPLCRPPPSSSNAPRLLARMRPGGTEPQVVVTRAVGANTSLLICDRAGHALYLATISGQFHLGANTRLVDLNRDLKPDIIRVFRGGYEVLENTSTETTFSFVRRPARPLAPAFNPSTTWINDMNGDGIADIVSRYPTGLVIWSGTGRFENLSAGQLFSFVTSTNNQLTNLNSFQLTFTDVDMNGLMDVLLSQGSSLYLFTNRGDHFRQAAVPGFTSIGWAFGYPVAADLEGHGEEQAVLVQGTHAFALTLTAPEAGLMREADDGKGSRIEFAYERAPATPGIDRRPSLLSSLTMHNAGYDTISYRYDYDEPFFHSAAQFLVGFGRVRKDAPQSVEEVEMFNDDDISGAVTGTRLVDARVPGLAQTTERTLEEGSFAGVRLVRAATETDGWMGDLGTVTAKTTEYLAYERGRCATETRTTSRHGTLLRTLVLSDVAGLDPDLHCLHGHERVEGQHPGHPELDFVHVLELERNTLGQITSITNMGAGSDPILMQEVGYDAQHRVASVSHPGRGTTAINYDPATGRLLDVTMPDGVITRVSASDALTDAVLELETLRGAQTWLESFRYDGQERLERRWDDAGGASELDPIVQFAYHYATEDRPGSIEMTTSIDPASGSARDDVELFAADGETLGKAMRIPEGWTISGLTAISRLRGVREVYWRAPITGAPEDQTLFELFGGPKTLLTTSAMTAFGAPLDERSLVQAGVTRSAVTELTVENGLLARTLYENGEVRGTVLEDGAGMIVERRDALGNRTTYRYDALGRLVEVVLPPSGDCG